MAQGMADEQSISVAVIVNQGNVLLIKRRVPEDQLIWQFPAGKIEQGETPSDAAVRETLEETDLIVRAVETIGERTHPTNGMHLTYIGCEMVSGTEGISAPEEVSDVIWCPVDEIEKYVPDGIFPPVLDYLRQTR